MIPLVLFVTVLHVNWVFSAVCSLLIVTWPSDVTSMVKLNGNHVFNFSDLQFVFIGIEEGVVGVTGFIWLIVFEDFLKKKTKSNTY